jgi:endonuclease/exonuclease/phosphatase (EEP) superfamily protein YafD
VFRPCLRPADHSRTREFLEELEAEVANCSLPLVVGGDFNLIRRSQDKSNEVVCWSRIRRFNDAIAAMALRELNRAGPRFTWTNNQVDPIRSVLDRVFVTPSWETIFPLCSLLGVTRIGSDHNPLLLDSGENGFKRPPRFFFQTCGLVWPVSTIL